MELDEICITTHNSENIDTNGIINPLSIDNRSQVSVPEDQQANPICSCVSVGNLIESIIWRITGKLININSTDIYKRAKQIDNMPNRAGTDLSSAIKAASELLECEIQYGVIDKIENKFEVIKHLIHKYGFILGGFYISSGWANCTEKQPVIKKTSIKVGNHAALICGYDKNGLYIQNSYGTTWGHKGFGILPYNIYAEEILYLCYIKSIKKDGMEYSIPSKTNNE